MSILDYIFSKLPDNSSKKITAKDVRDSFEKMDEQIDGVKSGIKGTATQSNAPTRYDPVNFPEDAERYPDGLFEIYQVRNPITSPNSWGNETVTQAELNDNLVYFDVNDGVVTKFSTSKKMPSGSAILTPTDDTQIPSSKATADYIELNQRIVIAKESTDEIQNLVDFEAGKYAMVTNDPNPYNNGIYKKVGGIGSGGWERTDFSNPVFTKPLGPNILWPTESISIGGGHTSLFQDVGEEGSGQGHTAFGFEAGLSLGNAWATTLVGWKAGRALSNKSVVNTWTGLIGNTGNSLFGYNVAASADGMLDCSYFGTSAGQNSTTCMDNAGFGIWSLRLIEAGSENAGFGHLSLGYLIGKGSAENVDSLVTDIASPLYSWGHRNVGVGDKAGALDNGGNALSYVKKCVYVGAKTTGNNYAYNENVFGYLAQGRGSNTVVIGNSNIKETTIHGSLRMPTLFTVATLPVGLSGERAFVTDATSTVFSANAVGGGSNRMPVYFDGNAWRIG